jgi:lipopolysaccharide biosynthesis regulator YciM
MMWEVLFLLLPIAAYSGWLLGRRALSLQTIRRFLKLSQSLDHAAPHDQIAGEFVKERMTYPNQEVMETHLALGGLFRREGQLDKAVGIHQHLINQRSLTPEQRALSLLELSRDYMRAGMLDRAEALLLDLSEQSYHLNGIFQVLLDIYQQTKDWSRAMEIANRWQRKTNLDLRVPIAHYQCEIAEQDCLKGEHSLAVQALQKALETNPLCVRASLLLGHIETQRGNYKKAMNAYEQIHKQDQDFLSEIILPLAKCYGALNQPEGMLRYFDTHLQASVTTMAVLNLCQWVCESQDEQTGMSFLRQYLQKRPSLRGLHRLMEWGIQQHPATPLSKDLALFQELLQGLLNNQALYRCQACGFSSKTLQWQCPSCKRWDQVKPVDE